MNQDSAPDTDIGWYISDTHARRALGYLSKVMPELHQVNPGTLLDLWGISLQQTIDPDERSPIGPEVVNHGTRA